MLAWLFVFLSLSMTPAHAEDEPRARIDNKAPAFALNDYEGKRHRSREFEGHWGLVIVFMESDSEECAAYYQRILKLQCRYDKKDVKFLGIDLTPRPRGQKIMADYRDAGINFPILRDTKRIIARQYEVRFVPTVFFLDKNMVLRYRGVIDDNATEATVTLRYLEKAIKAHLAGKEILVKEATPKVSNR